MKKLFVATDSDRDGFVTGLEAKTLFLRSTINNTDLAKIYSMSDIDTDSKLNKVEFFIAMKLITMRTSGAPIPESLPNDIFLSLGIAPPKLSRSVPGSKDKTVDTSKLELEKQKSNELSIQVEDFSNKLKKKTEQNYSKNKELDYLLKHKVQIEESHKLLVKEKSNLQKEIRNREQTIKQLQEQIMTVEGKLIRAEAKLGVKFSNTPDPLTEINERLNQINRNISEVQEKKRAALERAEKAESQIQEQNISNNQLPSSESENDNSEGGDDVIDFQINNSNQPSTIDESNPFLMGLNFPSTNNNNNQESGNNLFGFDFGKTT